MGEEIGTNNGLGNILCDESPNQLSSQPQTLLAVLEF